MKIVAQEWANAVPAPVTMHYVHVGIHVKETSDRSWALVLNKHDDRCGQCVVTVNVVCHAEVTYAVRRQKAAIGYFSSEKLLPFGFSKHI